MNRRGKRLALGVMAVGVAVVLVLAVAHWSTIRDHVEAWQFQLTTQTETIGPKDNLRGMAIFMRPWPAGNGEHMQARGG